MSYLPDFKYDVFLSYAHVDNLTASDKEEGWITIFYKRFKLLLDRYLEGTNTAQIWCDHELRKNNVFDDRIRNTIENSAIFLAFTSNGFFRSEYCCEKELNLFYNNAKNSSLGISINDNCRLFNIQLLNKSYKTWPAELQGTSGYSMYKFSDSRSLSRDEDQGMTLDPEQDRGDFEKRIVEIVQDVCKTLKQIKEKATPAPVEQTKQLKNKIFIGKVADTLLQVKNQLVNDLTAQDFIVENEKIPPPYDKEGHERLVKARISEAILSVHLFDNIAGDKISNDYPYSFSQEQFLIGRNLDKEQLLFIPQTLDLTGIDDKDHGKFLSDLLSKKELNAKYNLVRELSAPVIVDLIRDKIESLKPAPVTEGSILLDYNEADFKNAVEYYNSLLSENKKIYLTSPGSGPMDIINRYDSALREVTTVIIMCVSVAKEWLLERIKEIICAIQTGRSHITKLMVYKQSGIEDLNLAELKKLF